MYKNFETPFCPSWGVLYPSKSKIRMKNLPRGQRIRSSCFHDHDNSWWLKSLVDKNDNKLSKVLDFYLNLIFLETDYVGAQKMQRAFKIL